MEDLMMTAMMMQENIKLEDPNWLMNLFGNLMGLGGAYAGVNAIIKMNVAMHQNKKMEVLEHGMIGGIIAVIGTTGFIFFSSMGRSILAWTQANLF